MELDFSRLGKPTDNAMIEAFNARLRAECLNVSLVLVFGGRSEENRAVAPTFQRRTSPQRLGNFAPEAFALVATAGVQ